MKLLFSRMIKAARLDLSFVEEVVAEPKTQGHSYWVVAILAMATGYGMFSHAGVMAVNICLATTLVAWYIWAFTVYYFGRTFLFRDAVGQPDRKTIMRVVAFAQAPGLLRLLGVIPQVTVIIFLITSAWIILICVMGVQKAYQTPHTGRVALLCVATWAVVLFVQGLFFIIFLSVFGAS